VAAASQHCRVLLLAAAAVTAAAAAAAAAHRACWYDRLGYGWSGDAILYPTADQATVVLHNTLKAAGEAGPFIIAGHSAGGQLALAFAGYHPELVSGIALLDSYDDVAIALGYLGSREVTVTLPSGRTIVRPALSQMNPALVSVVDIVRGITPLAWARFITMKSGGSYPYQAELNAMYGEFDKTACCALIVCSALNV
jgi:pimeloyl-ACP methyl ester carboxylesterase